MTLALKRPTPPMERADDVRSPLSSPARVLLYAATIAVIALLALDIISGRWVGVPWLHMAAAMLLVLALTPFARRVPYLECAPIYTLGLLVYTILRSFASKTGIAPRDTYAIDLDKLLFFGHLPNSWLQSHLFDPTRVRPLDFFTVDVHWSYFVVPHLIAACIWLFRRPLFPRYSFFVLGTSYLGLLLYFLVPTIPPWLAADYGDLTGVSRVMDHVGHQIDPASYQRLYDALGVPNAVAAMPSLHMGVTFAVYLFARDLNRRLAWVLLAYSLAMGFSLVYMGEHYAIDVLAGMLCAFCIYRVSLLWRRRQETPTRS